MENLAYPTNILTELSIDARDVTDDVKKRFIETIDNGVLKDRLTFCIKSYYQDNMTLDAIGVELKLTRQRVRALIVDAKAQLSKYRAYFLGTEEFEAEIDRLKREINSLQSRLQNLQNIAKDVNLEELEQKYHESIKTNLDVSVDTIKFSTRTRNCLKEADIKTLRELFSKSEEELRSIRAFGTGCVNEVKHLAEFYGVEIK